MKKIFTLTALLGVFVANAQFTSNTLTLGSTGMTAKLETTTTMATLTLTGSSTSYLAIGFNAQGSGMANGSDAFIYTNNNNVDYTFTGVGNTPTLDAAQNWTISSNTVASGIRTIVATRALVGGTGDFTIPNAAGNIAISYAKGSSTTLANHNASRGYSTFVMTAAASNDTFETNKVKLYPNPTTDVVNFSGEVAIKNVTIYDITGKKVQSVALNNANSMNISTLSNGAYIFEIELNNNVKHYEKVIKE